MIHETSKHGKAEKKLSIAYSLRLVGCHIIAGDLEYQIARDLGQKSTKGKLWCSGKPQDKFVIGPDQCSNSRKTHCRVLEAEAEPGTLQVGGHFAGAGQ